MVEQVPGPSSDLPENRESPQREPAHTARQPADKPADKKNASPGRWRWIAIAGVIAVVILLLLVALVPWWVNVPPIKRMALGIYNRGIQGDLDVDRFELSWFNGQRLVGVTLYDPQGQFVAHMPVVETPDLNLIPIIRGTREYGQVDVHISQASLVQYQDGTLNAQRAMARPSTGQQPSTAPSSAGESDPLERLEQTDVQLNLRADEILYVGPAADPVEVRDLALMFDTMQPGQVLATVHARVQQNQAAGHLRADVQVSNLLAQASLDDAQVQADAELADVPAQAAGQMAQVAGLEALLGQRLTARIQASGQLGDLQTKITATSEHLDARINLTRQGHLLHITDSHANLHVTPQAWDQVINPRLARTVDPAEGDHPDPLAQLVEPFDIRMQIARLVLPSEDFAAHLGEVQADVLTELSDVVLQAADPRIGQVALRQTRLTAQSQAVAQGVTINLQAIPEQAGQQGELRVAVALADLLDEQGQPVLGQATAQVDANLNQVPIALVDQVMAMDGLLIDALGQTLQAQLVGQFSQDQQTDALAGTFQLHLASQQLTAQAQGQVHNQVLTLSDPSQATLTLTPQVAQRLLARDAQESTAPADDHSDNLLDHVQLAEPAQVTVGITALTVPLQDFDISRIQVGLTGLVDRMLLAGDPRFDGLAVEQLRLTMPPAQLDQTLDVELVGQLRQGQLGPANLHATAQLTDVMGDQPHGRMQGRIDQLPVALLENWQQTPGRLAATLGPQIDSLTFDVNLTDGQHVPAVLAIQTPNLQANLQADLVMGQAVTVRQSHVDLTLTPQALNAWQQTDDGQPPAMRLLEPAQVQVVVEEAVIALVPEEQAGPNQPAYDLARTRLTARLTSQQMRMQQGQQTAVTVQNLQATIESPALGQVVDLLADAQFLMQVPGEPEPRIGTLQSRNRLLHLINEQGEIDWDQLAFEIDTQVQDVPIDALDSLLNLSQRLGIPGPMSAVLGENVTMTLAASDSPQQAGELNMDLQTPFAQVHVPGRFVHDPSANGGPAGRVLQLRDEATATLIVQPGLSQQVLARINPVFVSALEASEPIQLTIDPASFTAPLSEFDISQMRADLSLRMGVLSLAHGGALDLILSLLNLSGNRITQAAVFPVNLRLDSGVLHYNQFVIDGQLTQRDMVLEINGMPIGFRGSVDLVNQQVNLETAFYPDTVNRLLPRQARFDAAQALVIPMTGSIASPQLDQQRFYEAIARFAGTEALRGVLPDEAQGLGNLLGGVLTGQPRQADGRDLSPLAQRLPPGYELPSMRHPPEAPAPSDTPEAPETPETPAPAEGQQPDRQEPRPDDEPDPLRQLRDLFRR